MGLLEQSWRSMDDFPSEADCAIVTDAEAVCAITFREGGYWWLGKRSEPHREYLDFMPKFWMPLKAPNNPFRAAFPDGRPSIAARHALALSKGSDT